jgi:hypothetical protein
MPALRRISWIGWGFIMVFGLVSVAGWLCCRPVGAQFKGERRRSDLNPITLPGGSVVDFKSFDSQSLGMPEHYSIFLPPSFSKDLSREYPAVYFLHGLNNDETSWTLERYGQLQNTIDQWNPITEQKKGVRTVRSAELQWVVMGH